MIENETFENISMTTRKGIGVELVILVLVPLRATLCHIP